QLAVTVAVVVHITKGLFCNRRALDEEANIELVGHADAAVHLDPFRADARESLADLRLREARKLRNFGRIAPLVECRERFQHDGFRELHLAEHVRRAMLESLERADGYAELLAVLQILHRAFETLLQATEHLGR